MYDPCRICGEPTTEHSNAVCNSCGATFHLALRMDVPAPDCGQVWINEDYLALEFACNACLTAAGDAAPPERATTAGAPADATRRRYTRREGTRAAEVIRSRRRHR